VIKASTSANSVLIDPKSGDDDFGFNFDFSSSTRILANSATDAFDLGFGKPAILINSKRELFLIPEK